MLNHALPPSPSTAGPAPGGGEGRGAPLLSAAASAGLLLLPPGAPGQRAACWAGPGAAWSSCRAGVQARPPPAPVPGPSGPLLSQAPGACRMSPRHTSPVSPACRGPARPTLSETVPHRGTPARGFWGPRGNLEAVARSTHGWPWETPHPPHLCLSTPRAPPGQPHPAQCPVPRSPCVRLHAGRARPAPPNSGSARGR